MSLHSVFEHLRAQAEVLNESIEPREYLILLCTLTLSK